MKSDVKVAFASASPELAPRFIESVARIRPDLDLFVVSEFPPGQGQWIQYHVHRTLGENLAKIRAGLQGRNVRLTALVLQPKAPYLAMRALAIAFAPLHTLYFNENLDHFMLRPAGLRQLLGHMKWRLRSAWEWHTNPGGGLYTLLWRVRHPHAFRRPWLHRRALAAGGALKRRKRAHSRVPIAVTAAELPLGVTVVIPSRNGKELLAVLLPGLRREMDGIDGEIIVVDNGSNDGTAEFLAAEYGSVRVIASGEPLSFARAVNRGIDTATWSKVLLLNNDMELHPGFFAPLLAAFGHVPDLFCATAQIFFPDGQRREETGKAFLRDRGPTYFPAYCADPLPGEDESYVLYGSGGCSLFDTAKLRALGRIDDIFEPAYVEDLDLGYRAWQQGWPTVFVADARVTHRHRATTSRYYSQEELDTFVEVNYLRFLARAVSDASIFEALWRRATDRLNRLVVQEVASAESALQEAASARTWPIRTDAVRFNDELILALGSGDVAVFPGRASRGLPVVLVATPYVPFPLSHGGAVRMFNLMTAAAASFDQVMVSFCDELATPAQELLDVCTEIVLVRRVGQHDRPPTDRPDVVEEFATPAYRAALQQTCRKWTPMVAQLEFTQMGQYARDCAPAKTMLVEHDITLDLYSQLLAEKDDWEMRRQLYRWTAFETQVWGDVDCVVAMSEKDRAIVTGARRVAVIPNGVDTQRFAPQHGWVEESRLLFIGSFAHLPNVIAMSWFLREVWPLLSGCGARLHIIAGSRHRYFLDLYRARVELPLPMADVVVEDFVADVRPAYASSAIVIAPLQASAGTNIKIMEAMSMEKAIVSTRGGVNGLDLTAGDDFVLAESPAEFASAIQRLLADDNERRRIERHARETVLSRYSWERIAAEQNRLYRELAGLDQSRRPTTE